MIISVERGTFGKELVCSSVRSKHLKGVAPTPTHLIFVEIRFVEKRRVVVDVDSASESGNLHILAGFGGFRFAESIAYRSAKKNVGKNHVLEDS